MITFLITIAVLVGVCILIHFFPVFFTKIFGWLFGNPYICLIIVLLAALGIMYIFTKVLSPMAREMRQNDKK